MSEHEPRTVPVPQGAVVVGIDGSATSERALAWAARYAELEGRPLLIAHALGFGAAEAAGMSFDGGASFALVHDQLRASGEALVTAAAAEVAESHPALAVTTVVEHQDPRQLMLVTAERASVLVMGSRGRGALRSLLLGSVASAVAGRAACPVVVIPATDDAASS